MPFSRSIAMYSAAVSGLPPSPSQASSVTWNGVVVSRRRRTPVLKRSIDRLSYLFSSSAGILEMTVLAASRSTSIEGIEQIRKVLKPKTCVIRRI
ncbi:hypothetical protein D9M70_585190 [compost metagenome]